MFLHFDKIVLNNFISFRHAEIDLTGSYCTLVTGKNNCNRDGAKSNGSGKSSIFNALCYALTGETVQGVSSGIENIYANPDDCWVELTFHVDNNEFVVKRIKTPRQNLIIKLNGEDISGKGIRESAQILQNYLPDLDSELLCNIIILGQGLPHRLSHYNPAGRKGILEKLTKSDYMIESIKNRLERRQDSLKAQLRSSEDSLLKQKTIKSTLLERIKNLEGSLIDVSNEDVLNAFSYLQDAEDSYSGLVNKKSTESAKLQLEFEHSNVINSEYTKRLAEINNRYSAQLNEANANKSNLKSEQNALKKEISKLESISDICPTCGQKLINVSKPSTKHQRERLKTLETELISADNKLASINSIKTVNINDLDKEFDSKKKSINESIDKYKSSISKLSIEIHDCDEERVKARENWIKLKTAYENKSHIEAELTSINDRLKQLEIDNASYESKIVEIKTRLLIVQQLITLAKREFRGVILSKVIEYINTRVKYYSKYVFGTDGLSFTLNENRIDIQYFEKQYENLSGGEQQKVDIIIQLALRDMLSKQLNTKSNILVCDEILDNLDSEGASKIIDVIQNKNEIESIFFISHHGEALNISYDRELIINKNSEGISELVTS